MKQKWIFIVSALSLFAAGCGSTPTPDGDSNPSPQAQTTSPINSWDDQLAQLSRQYPAFAGYYISDQQELVVLIASTYKGKAINDMQGSERGRKLGVIKNALLDLLKQESSPTLFDQNGQVTPHNKLKTRFEEVDTSFADLQDWRLALRKLMYQNAITELSIDQKTNQISIGLSSEAGRNTVFAELTRLHVPEQNQRVSIEQPVQTITLKDTIRPPIAGIEVVLPSGGSCTLGANVSFNGILGFLTAGHCTPQQGQNDGTTFRNGRDSNGNPLPYTIGTEYYDPPFSSASFCATESVGGTTIPCRLVDAVFAKYAVAANRGKMAKTTEVERTRILATDGSGAPLSYDVTSVVARPENGNILYNIGINGGYKFAKVINNNVDINYGTYVVVNAVKVYTTNNTPATCRGDSGGPWYFKTSSTTVAFAGIQSGGSGDVEANPDPNNANCFYSSYFTPVDSLNKAFGSSNILYTRP